jgi:hypothetical protein
MNFQSLTPIRLVRGVHRALILSLGPPPRYNEGTLIEAMQNAWRFVDDEVLRERYPLASVGTLVLGLRCSWCPGSAPMPKLLGLYALPPVAAAKARS